MNNLVLIRVAASLHEDLTGSAFVDLRLDPHGRFKLVFERGGRVRTVTVSADPVEPWIGRGAGRTRARPAGAFAGTVRRQLDRRILKRVAKPPAERLVRFEFRGGAALVVELGPHAPALVLLDDSGRIEAVSRRPARARERLAQGEPWRPPPRPEALADPFGLPATALAGLLDRRGAGPGGGLLGVDRATLDRVRAEAAAGGLAVETWLARRLTDLMEGRLDPVIDPREGLLPWLPQAGSPGAEDGSPVRGDDPAHTAALFHDPRDRRRLGGRRLETARSALRRELRRTRQAADKAAQDAERLGDPDLARRRGEALLAGLSSARRAGERVFVPDPYDPAGESLAVPVDPAASLPEAAEDWFRRSRRARRGLAAAAERRCRLEGRARRLEALEAGVDAGADPHDEAERLEQALQAEGVPVGLERADPARPTRRAARPERLPGIRVLAASTGESILVGKGGRENHHLTFRVAAPEDFWLHASGVPGAHVVIRNPERAARPPRQLLEEAAAVAAWFSDARQQPAADVRWTRRKYVRRPRGAPAGTVTLKRCETIRVRPRLPGGGTDRA